MTMKKLQRFFLAAATAASLATALSGCAPLLLGGAAMTAIVATDRRTSGAQLEDETIEFRASGRIRDALGDRVHVVVTSFNRQVLLTGEVPDQVTRETIEQIVRKVDNVNGVINELGIHIVSSLSQRSNDLLLTTKVRATLIDARDLSAGAFKVQTERGTVHLMGRVTAREAERATNLVRSISGVQRVVRAFEIITEEELQRMMPRQAAPAVAPVASAQSR
ncbi:MAG: BON domain-containing protein [Ramlibacter sp.]|jgi:osmotically-inducible protein OsmY|uniref:BON domain-containing protein n=1 Tax=Ramlibacter sp. TaxID=1917967 RepID=UPI0026289745|nr:BON domain-containing protein [Ramlibacter sp.]MDH4377767.1 BON domain-containing protein [Ramlibacter sp.]